LFAWLADNMLGATGAFAPTRTLGETRVKNFICILALALAPTLAGAAEKPDWAFPVTAKELPPERFAPDRVRTVGTVSVTRAGADDMYNIPNWRPQMYPALPKIVQHGNKDTQVRACGACHLPIGTGHDESAYMAGLPVRYFTQQMADWKNGDRKYGGTMIAMSKIITDAEIKEAAEYFAALKPTPWIRVVEADTVPKNYVAGGNKRLVHPAGGTEPIGNRIISVPEDEEAVVYRDPISGFVAYVPTGSIAKGKELASTGGGKTIACGICHGPGLQGLGDVPGIAGRHPSYIVRQMWNIQNGERTGNSAALMKAVVDKLSNDDMLAIAAYVGSLTP
jgi:cytochrome c553